MYLSKRFKQSLVTLTSAFYLSAASFTWADDTDIYLHNPNLDSGVQPNVLFILDNSGSMTYDAEGNRYSKNPSRMAELQTAFETLIKDSSGLNVGLMKLWARSGESSKLTFPVTDIEKALGSTVIIDGTPEILTSSDDGYETSTGHVVLTSEELPLGGESLAALRSSDLKEITVPVIQGIDNAEGSTDQYYLNQSGHSIRFGDVDRQDRNALYFRNLNLPSSAVIEEAFVRFIAAEPKTNTVDMEIFAEVKKRPKSFTRCDEQGSCENNARYHDRRKTSAYVDWRTSNWTQNHIYTTPDISPVIQSLLNDSRLNFAPSEFLNNLVLFFNVENARNNQSLPAYKIQQNGQNSSKAPLLTIKYRDSGQKQNYLTGLRFQGLGVPRGATITSASLEFTAKTNSNSHTSLNIWAGQPGNSNNAPFTTDGYNLSDRNKLGPVSWTPEQWTAGGDVTPEKYQADITSLLQQVTDSSSWCGNDAATFYINQPSGASGLREAFSFDGDSTFKPRLLVEYTGGENGCKNEQFDTRIQNFANDAYENHNQDLWQSDHSLRIGYGYQSGLHFPSLPIKKGAKILEARIEIAAYNSRDESSNMRIHAHDVDTSPAIVPESGNISERQKTHSVTNWPLSRWYKDEVYISPDISSVIQEIVDRDNWSAGNNLTLLLSASYGYRSIVSFDKNPGRAPRLVVKVASGGLNADRTYKVKDHLISLVNKMYPSGGTPLTPTYYEAAKYFKEGSGANPSPITNVCQRNYAVILTDGEANNNSWSAINNIADLTGNDSCYHDTPRDGERCSRTLASWLNETDLFPAMGNIQNVITHTIAFGKQNNDDVETFMKELAQNGGGNSYVATNAAALAKAFSNIKGSIIQDESSFVSPGVTANQFNNSRHLSQVYYSVFKPSKSDRWQGNLKKYQLIEDEKNGLTLDIYDKEPKLAVDKATGFFNKNAYSFWSDVSDGRSVDKGGAGSQIPAANDRNLFTFMGSNPGGQAVLLDQNTHKLHKNNASITTTLLDLPLSDTTTRDQTLEWIRDPAIWLGDPLHSTPALATYRCKVDVYPCPEYTSVKEADSDKVKRVEIQELMIFFGTNDGFFHGVNSISGKEEFAFMPAELLKNLPKLKQNETTDRTLGNGRPYGIDGSPTLWVNDINNNGVIYGGYDTLNDDTSKTFLDPDKPNAGEFVYAYVGMRRGGKSYYALDVTTPNSPKLLWKIAGGDTGFERLGQTWSKPVKTKIKTGSTTRDVLIFSGGYDPEQDKLSLYQTDAIGNAIYIVDAKTGALIWSASNDSTAKLELTKMNYSIPGGVRVIDLEGDGLADQLLFADVGGQIWRLFINNCTSSDTSECVVSNNSAMNQLVWPSDSDGDGHWAKDEGVFAYLGPNTNTQMDGAIIQKQNSRRFYVEPDASLFRLNGATHLALAIGSGNRPDPLGRVNEHIIDRAYSLATPSFENPKVTADNAAQKRVPNHTLLKHGNTQLLDITNTLAVSPEDTFGATTADSKKGWFITLEAGEKVMTETVTFEETMYFNTYLPSSKLLNTCNAVAGKARAYAVDLQTGTPVKDENDDGSLTTSDRYSNLANSGLPPNTSILFPEGSKDALVCVGAECDPLEIGADKQTTYWRQVR
ncbi:PilC/PilY family type IV pilus protein [uncultured Endozoicomonas sp.]|uniref:PilC/PilY family type IV pilus protein n=1 Tax=uncultured Endozoicomonas sp. TaxID=432652 RepID=UPI002602E8B2|nr:PilC/PilY family type IV pilus protein [uncultured Endozoicomonas sp.]